jgi:hyperosmotically inducible periplasmic protein
MAPGGMDVAAFRCESERRSVPVSTEDLSTRSLMSRGGLVMSMARLRNLFLVVLAPLCLSVACSQSDTVITARIKASMVADSTVNASQIEVATHDKVVTLTGNLDSEAEKARALEIAQGTSGVEKVVDLISVRTVAGKGEAPEPDRSLGEHIDDAVITAAVKGRLFEDPQVRGLKIDVDTREGVVFLTGNVRSQEEGDRAVEVARGTKHVKGVKPNLTIVRG